MARGKQTCKILKEIRRQIAEANGIDFVTSECRYKGDCLGTCPKCEAEVRYLEQQLRARSLAGKAIALAGISAGMILMSSCSSTTSSNQSNETLQGESIAPIEQIDVMESIEEEGELPAIEDTVVIKEGEMVDSEPKSVAGKVTVESNSFVDKSPEYPGGISALMQFLVSNLKYPKEWDEACISGKVIAKLEIDKNGKVGNVEIIRCTIPDEFSENVKNEVQRVIKLLPDFIPAQKNGKTVKSYYILPISFKLSDYVDYCD
ncbi:MULTISPECIES: energy transducer TonB [Bacteroidales]|uniref:energy transducer TonB n=1 Tax=Bacteroidales TaxID=171549 RepID=UPI00136F043D|nr:MULTISPECIES: energy transducer TonB [Bacteroidales]NBJ08736.1 energy transducer TonB [Alistipes sp. Z76]NCE70740.1 energy transducer TonB [Muribaculaceae bacterium M3]